MDTAQLSSLPGRLQKLQQRNVVFVISFPAYYWELFHMAFSVPISRINNSWPHMLFPIDEGTEPREGEDEDLLTLKQGDDTVFY